MLVTKQERLSKGVQQVTSDFLRVQRHYSDNGQNLNENYSVDNSFAAVGISRFCRLACSNVREVLDFREYEPQNI